MKPCHRFLQQATAEDVCKQGWLQSYLLTGQHARMQAINDLLLSLAAILWRGLA